MKSQASGIYISIRKHTEQVWEFSNQCSDFFEYVQCTMCNASGGQTFSLTADIDELNLVVILVEI